MHCLSKTGNGLMKLTADLSLEVQDEKQTTIKESTTHCTV